MVEGASAKLVYGDPVSVGGKTVLPVAAVRYGFGGGSGSNPEKAAHGGGGGGGLTAKPLGVVEVTELQTRFIPFNSHWTLLTAVGLGIALGWLITPKKAC